MIKERSMFKNVTKKYSRSDYSHRLIKNLTLRLITFLNKTNHKDRLNNLIVYSADVVGQEIVINGLFEAMELETLMKWLEENKLNNGIVLDIGANIGNHSIFFSKYFEKVFSYEPHSLSFKILELNAIKRQNISCFNFGLSDSEGSATIFVSGDYYGSARLHPSNSYIAEEQQIKLKTLDTHQLLKNEKVGLIKIDVEGHEIFALKGAKNLIVRDKPIIVFEQHRREFINGSTPVIEFLKSLDYNTFALIQETPTLPLWIPSFFRSRLVRLIKIFIGYQISIEEVNNIKPDFYSLIIAIPDEMRNE